MLPDAGVVEILNAQNRTVGTGFVVTARYIVTCAHVINLAGKAEGDTVGARFYALGRGLRQVKVAKLHEAEDVALLEMAFPPPSVVTPLALSEAAASVGGRYRALGFRQFGDMDGLAATGEIKHFGRGHDGQPRLQLERDELDKGHSGAPVWNEDWSAVVGMVASGAPHNSPELGIALTEIALAVPTETLIRLFPEWRAILQPAPLTTPRAPLPPAPPRPGHAKVFIDRGPIVQELLEELRRGGQTSLTGVQGMGGVGKTELARHVYERLRAEGRPVLWADAAERSAADVQVSLARDLNVDVSDCRDDRQRAERLRAALSQRAHIVFIDDLRAGFELEDCLPPSNCSLLITSRQRDWPGLQTRDLDVMTETQARALLDSEGLTETLDRELLAAADLIRLCARHPLALNLAARRLLKRRHDSATPVAAFNAGLADRLGTLHLQPTPLDSLRVNFDLSYTALTADQQRRFRQLAVFALAAGFTPQAAGAVWGLPPAEARDAIEQLQDASLVIPARLENAPGRFRLHDLLREYAREQLRVASDTHAAQRAHAKFLIALFNQHSTDDHSTAPHVTPEVDNLRAAAEWATDQRDGDLLAQLATTPRNWLYNFFRINAEWEGWLKTALAIGIEAKQLQANVLQAIGDVQQFRADRDAALQSYQQALALFKDIGAKLGEANVLKAIGDVQQFRDDRDAALQSYQQALALFKDIGAKLGEANVLQAIGDVQQFRDDRDAALQSYQQALALFKDIGAKLGEANVLTSQGRLYILSGKGQEGLNLLQEALGIYETIGSVTSQANIYFFLGQIMAGQGHPKEALPMLEQAVALGNQVAPGHPVSQYMQSVLEKVKADAANL